MTISSQSSRLRATSTRERLFDYTITKGVELHLVEAISKKANRRSCNPVKCPEDVYGRVKLAGYSDGCPAVEPSKPRPKPSIACFASNPLVSDPKSIDSIARYLLF